MNALIKFELIKILKRKSSKVAIVLMIIAVLIQIFIMVSSEYWVDAKGNEVQGLSSISSARQQTHESAGKLSTDKLAAAIENYHNVMNNPKNLVNPPDGSGLTFSDEAYGKYLEKDSEISILIYEAFAAENKNYDSNTIDSLSPEDASTFYQKRMDKVNDYLNMDYTYGNYTDADKAYFQKMNAKISIPLEFDYSEGWSNMIQDLSIIILAIAFVICVCIAPVFASEYQSGADSIILSSRYGKNKVITAKLKASFLFTTALFLFGLLLSAIIYLCIYGIYGWNCNVQILNLLAPANLTILQTYLLSALLGYLACLMVMTLILLLSAKMKSPFPVIICSALLLFGPSFLPYSKSSRMYNNLINLLPDKLMNGYSAFTHYAVYHIFGQPITAPYVMAAVAIIVTLAALPFAYLGFRRHQVV